jgi:hypothetical protein
MDFLWKSSARREFGAAVDKLPQLDDAA